MKLRDPLGEVPVVTHVRDLKRVDMALICVPAGAVLGVARELLQAQIPIVECAVLEGHTLERHYSAIGDAARHHSVPAIVEAGWNPGTLPLFEGAFTTLVPDGYTKCTNRPGAGLHHTEAAESIQGVKGALATDPLFVGEQTCVFEVDSIAALEEEGRGILLERVGTERTGAHAALLLEGRFDVPTFTARVMVDAAKCIPSLKPGAHRYSLWGVTHARN
jgi:diaminopimelate dehydrogenase